MSRSVRLTPDAEHALAEAEGICGRMNVAIVASEHLLAGALSVLRGNGVDYLPTAAAVLAGIEAIHGSSDEPLQARVMFGSNARQALNAAAAACREQGVFDIGPRDLALALLDSGEINPMFFAAMGTSKAGLTAALAGP